MKHIHFCNICSAYTMKEVCPTCSGKTILAKPPKYSVSDKYGKYRREAKLEKLKKRGLL